MYGSNSLYRVRMKSLMHLTMLPGVGRAFGELALMSEDSARNASIVADEDTDLLTINRDLFNRSLKVGT